MLSIIKRAMSQFSPAAPPVRFRPAPPVPRRRASPACRPGPRLPKISNMGTWRTRAGKPLVYGGHILTDSDGCPGADTCLSCLTGCCCGQVCNCNTDTGLCRNLTGTLTFAGLSDGPLVCCCTPGGAKPCVEGGGTSDCTTTLGGTAFVAHANCTCDSGYVWQFPSFSINLACPADCNGSSSTWTTNIELHVICNSGKLLASWRTVIAQPMTAATYSSNSSLVDLPATCDLRGLTFPGTMAGNDCPPGSGGCFCLTDGATWNFAIS